MATLQDENVHTEAAFIEHTPEGSHLVSFMEAEDVTAAMEAFDSSDHDIDEEFTQVLADALVTPNPVSEFEPLYVRQNPDRP